MPNNTLNVKITIRNDSKTNWTTNNPKPLKGEMCIEFDPSAESNSYSVKAKVGDGVHNYNDLPYLAGEAITVPAPDGTSIVTNNNVWSIAGFGAAAAGTFPVKRTTGGTDSIEWVTLPSHIADLDDMYTKLAGIEAGAQVNTVTSVAGKTGAVTLTASDASALPDSTKYGATLTLAIDSSTYVVTATLKDQDGNTLGTAQTIDLPLESVVVSGSYDAQTKEVVLTLQGGSTVRFSVADLVSGLQTEITSSNMLDADLVDDSTSTNKFTTAADITKLSGIAANAQVNVIESVSINGTALTITNKDVNIPIAAAAALGVVKSSSAGDQVAVGNDGTMTVNSLSTDKLTQGTDTLILQCGGAS